MAPFARPQTLAKASRALVLSRPVNTTLPSTSRSFTSTPRALSGGDGHDSHYDPPSGWLWGVPPGQKAEKEGWEGIWTYGFFGSIGVGIVAYVFKPDTSIDTWALEEAKRRLQAEGTIPEDE